MVLDQKFGKESINLIHVLFGHIGTKEILITICKYFYFSKMNKLVREFCSECHICIQK